MQWGHGPGDVRMALYWVGAGNHHLFSDILTQGVLNAPKGLI